MVFQWSHHLKTPPPRNDHRVSVSFSPPKQVHPGFLYEQVFSVSGLFANMLFRSFSPPCSRSFFHSSCPAANLGEQIYFLWALFARVTSPGSKLFSPGARFCKETRSLQDFCSIQPARGSRFSDSPFHHGGGVRGPPLSRWRRPNRTGTDFSSLSFPTFPAAV